MMDMDPPLIDTCLKLEHDEPVELVLPHTVHDPYPLASRS